MLTRLLVLRHGDRYDYAVGKDAWTARCTHSGGTLTPSDSPLSAHGHQQAREAAAFITSKHNVDAIICSPYLRALQTAQPLAHATGKPLFVDHALAESHQKPGALPPLAARLPYLPEIDDTYVPMMNSVVVDHEDGMEPDTEPRLEHMRRMLHLARELPRHPCFAGKTVALVTHGASLALIAALTSSSSLAAAGRFAACGTYELVLGGVDGSAKVVSKGDDPSAYLTTAGGGTVAWGFADSTEPLASIEAMWQEALRLGPTDLSKVASQSRAAIGSRGVHDTYEPESIVSADVRASDGDSRH